MTNLNKPIDKKAQERIRTLICDHRWGALATVGEWGPETSWVAYAVEPDWSAFLLHVSQLSLHTRNILKDPRISLAISEKEQAGCDPQQLARLMFDGHADVIPKQTIAYQRAAQRYQALLPSAVQLFEFSDFVLMRLWPDRVRFIGGFAQSHVLTLEALQTLVLKK